ncbi:MAG: hypothetical protein LUD02_15720 [Tannerellaceae bacterium]|nr:hypothetical protein [Tannerellaceae bacterium]MCD8265415.1 hypothetical protein [Tannerellaceae bacterium]
MLPILFVTYYSIVTFFMHAHTEHGTTFVHSHLFRLINEDDTCHEHSSIKEIYFYQILSDITIQDGAVQSFVLDCYSTPIAFLKQELVTCDLPNILPGDLSLCAPPAEV